MKTAQMEDQANTAATPTVRVADPAGFTPDPTLEKKPDREPRNSKTNPDPNFNYFRLFTAEMKSINCIYQYCQHKTG